MSAFEVTITPVRLKNKRRMESREPTDVVMAPFSAKAIVQFEDVPISKTARRLLNVINPTDDDIEVKVTKPLPSEHNISIEWEIKVIPAHSIVTMEMVWSPQIDVACKETLQLTDNRNFRKDVMVILKSLSTKPKNTRKFPTISSNSSTHVKTLRLKSPTSSTKLTFKQKVLGQVHQHQPQVRQKQQKPEKPTSTVIKTELRSVSTAKPSSIKNPSRLKAESNQEQSSNNTHTTPLMQRNVYLCVKQESVDGANILSPNLDVSDDNVKENVSPITPGSMLNLIDKLKFTPLTETKSYSDISQMNLALLPTPVSSDYQGEIKNLTEIRPRRIIETIETVEEVTTTSTCSVTNKTFELKRADTVDFSVNSTIDVFITPERDHSNETAIISTLNKTATLYATPKPRFLHMIEEESLIGASLLDVPNNVNNLQKTYTKADLDLKEDLKRDIKMVGTPLRKPSESMKELSVRSPASSKIAIQGSMPNLNEMETIQSIEKNRYFHRINNGGSHMSTINESSIMQQQEGNYNDCTSGALNLSQVSTISHIEEIFNQNEILAQSSRVNINEVGLKSRKNSPVKMKYFESKSSSKDAFNLQHIKRTPSKSMNKFSPSTPEKKIKNYKQSNNVSMDSPDDSLTASIKRSKTPRHCDISPPKRQRFETSSVSHTPNRAGTRGSSWSQTQPKKFKLAKTLSLLKKPVTPRRTRDEPRIKLYDSDIFLQPHINPDPFAATTTCDPFLASTMYLDEQAVEKHQIDFKKWLNALVSIPADLDADSNAKIDVGKLFNEVRSKDLILAPTKEEQCMNYLTKFRLESLRRAAIQLYFSDQMTVPCSKVAVYIKKNALRIRSDRNLHLDVVMQRYILELLLCFNPLWLRLGLEVVFGEKVHLQSNKDIIGLSTFILNRLFRDKFLEQKYSKAYTLSDEYAEHIKKFTLQKFLFLLLFLDKAKQQRIVKHNPCLFVKKSPHKETKIILLKFSSELLANMGDVTRELKRLGYVLEHKQSYLDEFDYAFNNLAVDLRDGIRLTRVMEIILLRDDLSKLLRVPAISRLQRIFNVNLGMRALSEAEFELKGDITAADIVDGHREKTLSLLWQLIYKFRSPKFHAAARVLQNWWRQSWLRVCIKRRIRHKEMLRQAAAATKIQAAFRAYLTRKYVRFYLEERTQAVIVLQKYARRFVARLRFYRTLSCIVVIQRWFRAHTMGIKSRKQFLIIRNSVIVLQRWTRRHFVARRLLQRAEEIKLKVHEKREAAATCVQIYWRSYLQMCEARASYQLQRESAIVLQRRYRAKKCMQLQLSSYQSLRELTIRIQQRFRAKKQMLMQREQYVRMRNCVINLQRRRRALLQMRIDHAQYLQQRKSIIILQRRVRATQAMQKQRTAYLELLKYTCIVQQRYRATQAMKQQVIAYKHIVSKVIHIQRKWRATLLARKVQLDYITFRNAIILVQKRFRDKKLMQAQSKQYQIKRQCVIKLQRRRRALLQMRAAQSDYLNQRKTIIKLQQRVRATQAMHRQRTTYLNLRKYACIVQQRFRATQAMKQQVISYNATISKIICIQRKWRATKLARVVKFQFVNYRYHVLLVQQRFRANKLMREQRTIFEQLKKTVITVQRRYRAKKLMLQQRIGFQQLQRAVITIQHRFRAYKKMRFFRAKYQGTREAVICLQEHIRGYLLMKQDRSKFLQLRNAALVIQRAFRARCAMLKQRSSYLCILKSAKCLQQRYRALQKMRLQQQEYAQKRQLIINVQRRFRSKLLARRIRLEYVQTLTIICKVQQRYRAKLLMRATRATYQETVQKVINIQRYYRAHLQMKKAVAEFQQKKKAVILIQRWFRSVLHMRNEQCTYTRLRSSSLVLQRKWRATLAAREQRRRYVQTVQKVICIQRVLRATLQMRKQRLQYQRICWAATVLQRRYRARLEMLKIRSQYLLIRSLIICIQSKYRAKLQMKKNRYDYLLLKQTTIYLQQKYRARTEGRATRERFLNFLKTLSDFQTYARGYLARIRYQAMLTPDMLELHRQRKAAIIIQRYWRGHHVRQLGRNVRVKQIRKKIASLKKTSNASESIRFKMYDAVKVLRSQSSASEVLQVLIRFDRLSRTVPHLLMCHSEFVSTFCYGIMAQSIRSEVDKQLIRYCSRVILNLARYNSTTANTFQENGLVTIAQMLLRWCDKDCEIFNTLCTLIWIFIHCSQKRKIIYDFMTTPEAIYMVRETKKLVARKEKMKQNVRKPNISAISSTPTSSSRGLTRQNSQTNFSSRSLPSLEPDFGVIHNKPYTFISSVYAFDTILSKLGIDVV